MVQQLATAASYYFQESIAPLTKKTQQIDTLLQQNLVHGHLDHNYQDYLRWLI